MEQYAIVVKTENKKALVNIIKNPDCDKACSECNLCGNKEITEWVDNSVGAEVSEKVKIDIKPTPFLTMSFTIYILPIILVVLTYTIVKNLFGETLADLSSIITAILSISIVSFLGGRLFKQEKFRYKITERNIK